MIPLIKFWYKYKVIQKNFYRVFDITINKIFGMNIKV